MKQVRLTVKLMGGFALVALVTLLVGIFGWYGASQLGSNLQGVVNTTLPSIQNVLTIKESLESVRVATRTLLNPFLTPEVRKRQLDNIKAARDRVKTAMDSLEPLLQSESEKAVWMQFVPALSAYVQETDNFLQLAHELDLTGVLNPLALRSEMERFRGDHYNVLNKTAYLLATQTSFDGSEDPSGCDFGKWMAKYQANNPRIAAALKEIAASHAVFHHDVKKIKDNVKNHELDGAVLLYRQEMVPAAEKTIGLMGQILAEANLASDLYSKMNEQAMVVTYAKQREALGQLDKLVTMQKDDAQTTRVAAQAATTRTKWLVLVGMGVGVVAAVLLGMFASLSVTRPLNHVILGLTEGAEQVAAASGEVSNASQQLAEGASQQAAAVEETSSSLEQLSSMTRQNADNAREADQIMKEVHKIIDQANQSMQQLTSSMSAISKASLDTQKIIKTIDEIAFQTNLLALNAAVEAARAGEAGAGFAVVADEVRNLAMRAAEAAKNTANLIEGTMREVSDGSGLVTRTNQEFVALVSGVNRAGGLVGEIAEASGEQAQGIEQINRAVTEMDKVIQQNAANAEESASASEQLNAQAEQMRSYVSDLANLVGGNGGKHTSSQHAYVTKAMIPGRTGGFHGALTRVGQPSGKNIVARIPAVASGLREVRPNQLIPLEEAGTGDF